MFRTLLCDESHQFRVVEDLTAISHLVQHKGRHLWLDLEQPTAADMQLMQEEFALHPLAIEDAMARHQRPKIDQYDCFYLVIFYSVACLDPAEPAPPAGRQGLRGASFLRSDSAGPAAGADEAAGTPSDGVQALDLPVTGPDTTPPRPRGAPASDRADARESPPNVERILLRELTMFMGENYLITVHNDPLPELDEVARRWRRNVEALTDWPASAVPALPGTRPLTPEERGHLKRQPPALHDRPLLPPTAETAVPNRSTNIPASGIADNRAPFPPHPVRSVDVGDQAGVQRPRGNDIGILLYSLLDTIVDDYFPVVDSIVERVEDLEEQVFQRFDQQAIASIFTLKKDLLALRKVLAPERDVLNILVRRDLTIFEEHTLVYFQDIYDHVVRITDSIDTYRDLLSSALDGYLSMQSNRLNVTVQTLTSVSIMLMSVAAVTGWYGMNFAAMPELQQWWGYPGVVVLLVLIIIVEFIFFKRKRWL
jgi:Mg2+ and Co2+ transporter CorA